MIICVCNALRERECVAAADCPTIRYPGCLYRRLGVKVQCGRCVPTVRRIVEAAKQRRGDAAELERIA